LLATLLLLGSALSGCRVAAPGGHALSALDTLVSPAVIPAAEPNLFATRDGRVHMSWLERGEGRLATLRFATLEGDRWSAPVTIASGTDFFVNWADFPSIVELPDGRLAAHWLQRSGPGTYHYDVRIAQSADAGLNWSSAVTPHRDGVLAEHGFVSLFPWEGDSLGAVWLDGRRFTDHEDASNEMMLYHTTISAGGELGAERPLDQRVCECCQTSAAMTARGPVIVFRDRSPGDVRDIGIVRRVDGAWTPTSLVHADGWQIGACPVNGPAAAARGELLAVAWFTAPDDSPRVNLAFSFDAGESFAPPVRVDDGDPVGRVSIVLDGESAVVSWLERVDQQAQVRVRRITSDGRRSAASVVGSSTSARASGFPRMAHDGRGVVFAWTQPGDSARIVVARGSLGHLR
jgi:hypothetical protein